MEVAPCTVQWAMLVVMFAKVVGLFVDVLLRCWRFLHLARLHLVIVSRVVYKHIKSDLPKYKKAGFVILPFYINFA